MLAVLKFWPNASRERRAGAFLSRLWTGFSGTFTNIQPAGRNIQNEREGAHVVHRIILLMSEKGALN